MTVARRTVSLSEANDKYAIKKSKLFDGKLSKYVNYLLDKERMKESNRN